MNETIPFKMYMNTYVIEIMVITNILSDKVGLGPLYVHCHLFQLLRNRPLLSCDDYGIWNVTKIIFYSNII